MFAINLQLKVQVPSSNDLSALDYNYLKEVSTYKT